MLGNTGKQQGWLPKSSRGRYHRYSPENNLKFNTREAHLQGNFQHVIILLITGRGPASIPGVYIFFELFGVYWIEVEVLSDGLYYRVYMVKKPIATFLMFREIWEVISPCR